MLWFNNQNIAIFFSQKSDGDLLFKTRTNTDLTRTDTDPTRTNTDLTQTNTEELNKKVRQNRICFFEKNKIAPQRLVNLAGVHGTNIGTITCDSTLGSGSLNPNSRIPDTDGLITNIRNSYLMITGADCFPVFFWDSVKNVIGIAHCGWRSIINADLRGLNADLRGQKDGIAIEMIKKFKADFGSNPTDIQVWLGPGIKSCHFEVKNDVAELFEKNFKNAIINRGAKIFIDLPKVIMLQLIEAGVMPENITEHPDCTYCQKDKYFSYRRDKPETLEANAFIIHLK